jgi:hypothetical protein
MTGAQKPLFDFKRGQGEVLLIACGALGREVVQLIEWNGWRHLDVAAIPAKLHHRPEEIPEAVRAKIHAARDGSLGNRYDKIYVLYGDCGTGGLLDRVLEEEGGVERIPGPHCFSFFAGNMDFAKRAENEITTFYLTDFFCRHFESIVWKAIGLDRRADMVSFVFGNYEKLVFLAQSEDPDLEQKAQEIAERLGLTYERRFCGFGDLEIFMAELPEA